MLDKWWKTFLLSFFAGMLGGTIVSLCFKKISIDFGTVPDWFGLIILLFFGSTFLDRIHRNGEVQLSITQESSSDDAPYAMYGIRVKNFTKNKMVVVERGILVVKKDEKKIKLSNAKRNTIPTMFEKIVVEPGDISDAEVNSEDVALLEATMGFQISDAIENLELIPYAKLVDGSYIYGQKSTYLNWKKLDKDMEDRYK